MIDNVIVSPSGIIEITKTIFFFMPEDVEIEMLTYDLTSRRGTLCRRLYECIKSDVLSGKLSAGEKLPSKRSLARNLGVSAITVENAYDQLIAEGYAISEQRRGYYVSEYASKRKEIGNHATSPTWGVAPKGEERLYFDFSSNQTENANFPFSVWARMLPVMSSVSVRTPRRKPAA